MKKISVLFVLLTGGIALCGAVLDTRQLTKDGILSYAEESHIIVLARVEKKETLQLNRSKIPLLELRPLSYIKGTHPDVTLRVENSGYGHVQYNDHKGRRDPKLMDGKIYLFFLTLNPAFCYQTRTMIYSRVVIMRWFMLKEVRSLGIVKGRPLILKAVLRIPNSGEKNVRGRISRFCMDYYQNLLWARHIIQLNRLGRGSFFTQYVYVFFPVHDYMKSLSAEKHKKLIEKPKLFNQVLKKPEN